MELEQLKQSEFRHHLTNHTLRLAFIGMSNAGKSYRSKVLRDQADFYWYSVDEEILKNLNIDSMLAISHWLGYPNTSTYPEREKTYLDAEARATKVDFLNTQGKNLVFDTTGSVIYLSKEVLTWLKHECLLVNLDVGDDAVQEMLEKFIKEPKPVIWHGFFKPDVTETETETIARCYPALLKARLTQYRSLGHLTIPAIKLRDKSASEMLSIIESYLPQ